MVTIFRWKEEDCCIGNAWTAIIYDEFGRVEGRIKLKSKRSKRSLVLYRNHFLMPTSTYIICIFVIKKSFGFSLLSALVQIAVRLMSFV